MKLIEFNKVSFSYERKLALKDVDFSLSSGDFICVVGENGSGKSTLIKGMLKLKIPSKGSIKFDKSLLKKEVGYLPQQKSMMKDFPATVHEVVLSGRLSQMGMRPFYTKKDRMIAKENINKLGIDHIRHKSYMDLSGGQQQRVLLARALCSCKQLLVLDEPVSGLDPLVTAELYRLVKDLNEVDKMTVVMVTHDVEEALKYGSHILHLANEQLYFGTCSDYRQTQVGKQYLGGGKIV